jgi:hypothetical protein
MKQELSKEIKTLLAIKKMQGDTMLCLALGMNEIKCPAGLCSECPYYAGDERGKYKY